MLIFKSKSQTLSICSDLCDNDRFERWKKLLHLDQNLFVDWRMLWRLSPSNEFWEPLTIVADSVAILANPKRLKLRNLQMIVCETGESLGHCLGNLDIWCLRIHPRCTVPYAVQNGGHVPFHNTKFSHLGAVPAALKNPLGTLFPPPACLSFFQELQTSRRFGDFQFI